MPVDHEENGCLDLESALKKLNHPPINGKLKRKLKDERVTNFLAKKNFEFTTFSDPVLFVGHLSKNSLLLVDKPWLDIVKSFGTQPVHRHIFGM